MIVNKKAQAGNAVIWGAGALLILVGLILFMQSLNEKRDGPPELSFLEAFVAVVLIIFGIVSFYMAHK